MNVKNSVLVVMILSVCAVDNLGSQQIPGGDPNPKIMEQLGANMSRVRPTNTPYELWFEKAKKKDTDI